jgi:hypothetical protein
MNPVKEAGHPVETFSIQAISIFEEEVHAVSSTTKQI